MPIDRSVGNYFDSSASFLRRVARWTGPAAYVTGGEAVDAAAFGLGKIIVILFGAASSGTATRFLAYNPTTGKIQYFLPDGTEVANGVDLSTYSTGFEVIGQ